MKFLVIKDLDASGQVTKEWTAAMQNALSQKPEALRKDYAKLVESIARLQVIETTLRKEVLHGDTGTEGLRNVAESYLPVIGGALFSGGTSILNTFLTALTASISSTLTKKVF